MQKKTEEYLPLVRALVTKYVRQIPPDLDRDDLINSGVIGLIRAIQTYDPTRTDTFKPYAIFKIKFAILEELRNRSFISAWYKDRGVKLVSSDDETALRNSEKSMLVKESQLTPHDELERTELNKVLYEALCKLTKHQRIILFMYYYSGFYFEEIAKNLDVSYTAVGSLRNRAFARLRSKSHAKLQHAFSESKHALL